MGNSLVTISNSKVMFIRNFEIFHALPSICTYVLIRREFPSRIVELVYERVCVVFSGDVTFVVCEGEKQISIDGEMFHSVS